MKNSKIEIIQTKIRTKNMLNSLKKIEEDYNSVILRLIKDKRALSGNKVYFILHVKKRNKQEEVSSPFYFANRHVLVAVLGNLREFNERVIKRVSARGNDGIVYLPYRWIGSQVLVFCLRR